MAAAGRGGGLRSPRRERAAEPRGARAARGGRRDGGGGWLGRSASSDFRYCAPASSGAMSPGDEAAGVRQPRARRALSKPLYSCRGGGGKEVRGAGGGGPGRRGALGGSGLEALESWGPEAISPASRGCSPPGDWRVAAAPLAPSPRSRWPETRSLPTKNSGPPGLLRAL